MEHPDISSKPFRPRLPPTGLPYRVRTLGRIRGDAYHTTPGTHHEDVMLTVVLGGRGRYFPPTVAGSAGVGSSRKVERYLPIEAGMVGLVRGGDRERPGLLMADPHEPYDHVYCRFAGGWAVAAAERIRDVWQGQRFVNDERWRDVAEVLLRALALGRVDSQSRRSDRLTRQDAALAEALAILETDPPPDGPRLTADRLRTYMEHHLARPADLDAVAQHFAVSKGHLSREARRLLGEPLHQAWVRLKMDRARILLSEPSLNMTQVAHRVGYSDPLYFSKAFKKHTGQPPSALRG